MCGTQAPKDIILTSKLFFVIKVKKEIPGLIFGLWVHYFFPLLSFFFIFISYVLKYSVHIYRPYIHHVLFIFFFTCIK